MGRSDVAWEMNEVRVHLIEGLLITGVGKFVFRDKRFWGPTFFGWISAFERTQPRRSIGFTRSDLRLILFPFEKRRLVPAAGLVLPR